MAVVILAFAALWAIDLHRLVSAKTEAQNAGDSAALAAARWQGATLNLEGELNLLHALALSARDAAAVDAITNMQARLAFTGPLAALVAAQVAAKNNRTYSEPDFTALMKERSRDALQYGSTVGGAMAFPEPYPGAWAEYSDMLAAIAGDGIAAAPDNALFFGDRTAGHILLDSGFYDAVAGRQWCWFYLNYATGGAGSTRTILDEFTDYTWFDPLPPPDPPLYENSEIFGVGLVKRRLALERVGGAEDAMTAAADAQAIDMAGYVRTNVLPVVENWLFYDRSFWDSPWVGMDESAGDFLPMAGSVKAEYNYTGADAVVRLYRTATRVSPAGGDNEDAIVWTAAAKPFGYLTDGDDASGARILPCAYGLVLPAFRDIRLIPIDAASSGGKGAFDLDWRRHTDEHLPVYLETGAITPGCRFCALIRKFENPAFRKVGSEWLVENHGLCTLPSHSGGHRGGGTRRGH